jgi:hypothetical protein
MNDQINKEHDIMSATDTVKTFMAALEGNEFEEAASYLADDFLMTGWTPQPLNKAAFLDVMKGLKGGIPGLIFNLHNVSEQDNTVRGTIQVAGYQTDAINLPALSLPPIPQMGRSVSLPTEDVAFHVENNRILSMIVHHVAGGGIQGLLHQLGTDSPILQ